MPVVGMIEPCDTFPTTYMAGGFNNQWLPAVSGAGTGAVTVDTVDKVEGVGSLSLTSSNTPMFRMLLGNGMGWGSTMPNGGLSNQNPIFYFWVKISAGVNLTFQAVRADNTFIDYVIPQPAPDVWTEIAIDLRQSVQGVIDVDLAGFWNMYFYFNATAGNLPAQVARMDFIGYGTSGATPLTVTVSPTSVNVNEGTPFTLNAAVMGGTPPYNTVNWFDSANNNIGTGSSITLDLVAGTYSVYAVVTDSVGGSANSATVPITVTGVTPTWQLTIDSRDSLGNTITGVPFTITKV